MKKITFLFALLCASVMGWGTQCCNTLLTSANSAAHAGDCLNDEVYFTASKTGELETTFSITSTKRTLTGAIFNGQALMQNPGGGTLDGDFATGWTLSGNTLTKVATWTTYPTGNIQVYVVVEVEGAPNITGAQIPNLDVSAACGGGSTPPATKYAITVTQPAAGGTIGADVEEAAAGATVHLTATPASGKALDEWIVTAGSDPVTVTNNQFTMPASAVTVTATFKDHDPNEYTAGGHTIHLEAYYVGDLYTLIITSADDMTGLGGSFWFIDGVAKDMRTNNSTLSYVVSGDKKTITCSAQSSSAPTFDNNLYILFPGEINFGKPTLNWEDRTPITSEYCNYQGPETQQDNHYYAITWETDPSGNVVITIGNGTGAGACSFRNGGFEGGNNGLANFVVSDDDFATTTPATDYFTVTRPSDGDLQYVMTKIADLPAGAKIRHLTSGAIAWKEAGVDRWCWPEFTYTYGGTCNQLDAPTNVAIDADSIITFDAVTGADKYTAYIALGGVEKYQQEVTSGDKLHFIPYVDGAYDVTIVASGAGKVDSDPSTTFVWNLEAVPVVLGNSEYCESAIGSGNQLAAITWETNDDGNIVITLKETLGGGEDDTQFRGANGMALANFQVGEARTGAGAYFNHTKSGKTITLSLKNSSVKPGLGEKIYYTDKVVEYVTSQNDNAYGNMTFEYTYGAKCSGQKHVSVAVNDNAMGSATVNGEAAVDVDENTQVTCVATPAEGYEFVNWTIGGVEVATTATYQPTITAATSLVANFDYARTTYCHTAVQTSGNKKVYLTVGKGATEGTYQIKIYGSDELTITGINNANTAINHVKYLTYDGSDVPLTIANGGWTFSNEGYGVITSAELRPQTNHTWRDMWMWRPDLFMGTSAGQQVINDILDNEHYFNWDNTCTDTEAPSFDKAEAEVLNESSVRLKIQASDNWEGLLTYTIAREAAEPIISNHASGEEFTQVVEGLTAGTEYTFTVTVSDGVNNANQNIVVTPVGDTDAPVMGEASLASVECFKAVINVAATDNKGVTAYHVVDGDHSYDDNLEATEGQITLTGLNDAINYSFTITAKDAASNESANNAVVAVSTKSSVPTIKAPIPEVPANQVKSLYSDTYEFAPASLNSYNEGWYKAPSMTTVTVEGSEYLKYYGDMSGMVGWQFGSISVSIMEYVHVDIWPSANGTITMGPTSAAEPNQVASVTRNVVAGEWNSIDISMAELQAANASFDPAKLFQNQFTGYAAQVVFSVDNVYFYRTTPPPADETAPTAVTVNSTVASFTSATIKAQANDDSGVVHFKVLNGSDVLVADVEALSGTEATIVVNGLAYNTAYNLSLIAYDEASHEAEPVAVAFSTLSGPAAAPQPTHDAIAVLSVFSDAYEPAVAASFNRTNWGSAPVGMEADYILYTMSANVIVWGNNDGNAGHGNIDGLSGHTYDDKPGLDISDMDYIHFDVWCDAADQLNTVNINDQAIAIPTTRTVAGEWVSFDVAIGSVPLADRQNLRWLKFHPFNTANCVAAIDNVYFWKAPVVTRDDSWMAPGELGTICIPQGAIAVGGDIYELMGKDEQGKIVFATVTDNHMAPGKPYLFEATSNEMRFYNTGETPATEPDNSGAMKGSFINDVLYELDGVCYFNGRELWSCSNLTQLNIIANRAYVQLNDVQPIQNSTPAPGRRFITMGVFGQNAATGIDQLNGVEAPVKVMIDGQLYILRGEKMYNANGQIVK